MEYIVAGDILLKSDCQMGACSGAVGIIPFNCRMDSGDGGFTPSSGRREESSRRMAEKFATARGELNASTYTAVNQTPDFLGVAKWTLTW